MCIYDSPRPGNHSPFNSFNTPVPTAVEFSWSSEAPVQHGEWIFNCIFPGPLQPRDSDCNRLEWTLNSGNVFGALLLHNGWQLFRNGWLILTISPSIFHEFGNRRFRQSYSFNGVVPRLPITAWRRNTIGRATTTLKLT